MITLEPIGIVKNSRKEISDDYWGGLISQIILNGNYEEDSLKGIEEFSHLEIIFYFDKVLTGKIKSVASHPRSNPAWPEVGILAQLGKNRPNRLGLTIVKLIKRESGILFVTGLDAIDGTPVLDIKPVMKEFLPSDEIKQPLWAAELMLNYWKSKS
jgi:tRNA-Thr(GGU) m(6)t(6)A37 methyltransferase TsaA